MTPDEKRAAAAMLRDLAERDNPQFSDGGNAQTRRNAEALAVSLEREAAERENPPADSLRAALEGALRWVVSDYDASQAARSAGYGSSLARAVAHARGILRDRDLVRP